MHDAYGGAEESVDKVRGKVWEGFGDSEGVLRTVSATESTCHASTLCHMCCWHGCLHLKLLAAAMRVHLFVPPSPPPSSHLLP